jgi:hypothetical protein
MSTFHAPQYTKVVNPKTGIQESCYTFRIDYNTDDYLSFIAENKTDMSVQSLQKCIENNANWWNTFLQSFLSASSKFFSKQHTHHTINKVAKHSVNDTINEIYPINVILSPKCIKICGGVFNIEWGYNLEPMIDIPDVVECSMQLLQLQPTVQLSNSPPVSNGEHGIQELNIDDLSVENSNTDTLLNIDNPAKIYEKQRVKESRLKAKLALYKAQRQMVDYYKKYGDDSSETDTDYETSDDDDDDSVNDLEEEIQI